MSAARQVMKGWDGSTSDCHAAGMVPRLQASSSVCLVLARSPPANHERMLTATRPSFNPQFKATQYEGYTVPVAQSHLAGSPGGLVKYTPLSNFSSAEVWNLHDVAYASAI